ncbi:MAG: hypothetical protein WC413_00410 [Candidatus Nanoarchaeia archaeon]
MFDLAKTFLAIGIAVIFAIFIGYGLHVVYEIPTAYSSHNSECSKTYKCEQQIYDCQKQYTSDSGMARDCYSSVPQTPQYKTCQENLFKCNEEATKKSPQYIHSRNSFYILILIGIITIITGLFLSSLEGIGSGLIGGGVLVVIWSLFYTARYWSTLPKYLKLAALGIVLVVLIYFGYKKLESRQTTL